MVCLTHQKFALAVGGKAGREAQYQQKISSVPFVPLYGGSNICHLESRLNMRVLYLETEVIESKLPPVLLTQFVEPAYKQSPTVKICLFG